MALNLRRSMLELIGAGIISAILGCASAEPSAKVYHRLQIEVHKTTVQLKNIRFTYGDDFVDSLVPSARAIGAFEDYSAPMRIPDEFDIRWETQDGKKHEAKVPVRSRLPDSIENKSIIFVIMPDHVEGFIGVSTSYGQKRERFY